jgi:hypothetical protein
MTWQNPRYFHPGGYLSYFSHYVHDIYGQPVENVWVCTLCAARVVADQRHWDQHIEYHQWDASRGDEEWSQCDTCHQRVPITMFSMHLHHHIQQNKEKKLVRKALFALLSGEKLDLSDLEELIEGLSE